MRNHPAYKALVRKSIDEGWTAKQIQAATVQQLSTQVGVDLRNKSEAFFANLKGNLIADIGERKVNYRLAHKAELKEQLLSLLQKDFPDVDFDWGVDDGFYVKLYVDGKY